MKDKNSIWPKVSIFASRYSHAKRNPFDKGFADQFEMSEFQYRLVKFIVRLLPDRCIDALLLIPIEAERSEYKWYQASRNVTGKIPDPRGSWDQHKFTARQSRKTSTTQKILDSRATIFLEVTMIKQPL